MKGIMWSYRYPIFRLLAKDMYGIYVFSTEMYF